MTVRSRTWITVDPQTAPMVLSDRGAALGIRGFVHGRGVAPIRMDLVLHHAGGRLAAVRAYLQIGLLEPGDRNFHPAPDDSMEGGFYVSAVFPPDHTLRSGTALVGARIVWADAVESEVSLCTVDVVRVDPLPDPEAAGTIGIALTTYEPNLDLFARQVASIIAQTDVHWRCVIADDGSSPDAVARIAETIAGDRRFHLLPPGPRLGFYRNFERACAALPSTCAFVAFSDQDDDWMPSRLARQRAALDGLPFGCCYGDMEIIDESGRVLSPTFWIHRKRRYGNLNGLLLGNVVTGMTILARRELIARALPFPATPGLTYHDHWIALVAERLGSLRYLDEPLVRYVQHGGNHTGALTPSSTSWAVTKQALGRIARLMWIGFVRQRLRDILREPNLLDWTDQEPTRLRILVDRLVDETSLPGDRSLVRLTRRFGFLRTATCGAAWGDRYRRAYAIDLTFGAFLKERVLARVLSVRSHSKFREP